MGEVARRAAVLGLFAFGCAVAAWLGARLQRWRIAARWQEDTRCAGCSRPVAICDCTTGKRAAKARGLGEQG